MAIEFTLLQTLAGLFPAEYNSALHPLLHPLYSTIQQFNNLTMSLTASCRCYYHSPLASALNSHYSLMLMRTLLMNEMSLSSLLPILLFLPQFFPLNFSMPAS